MRGVRIALVIAVVVAAVFVAGTTFYTVDETQFAVVTRFGSPIRVIEGAGPYFKLPAPLDRVWYIDRRLLTLDQPGAGQNPSEFPTLDKKHVEISSFTCWRVSDPRRFLEGLGTRGACESILADVVTAELGKSIGRRNLSALVSIRPEELELDAIMGEVREAVGRMASREYGVEVVDFRVKRVTFPEQNRSAVFERMRQERKRIATRYRSEGEEAAAKLRGEADRKVRETLADADRTAREIEGQGEAEATRIYAEAYQADPEFYEFVRTLQSYRTSLSKLTTLVLPADSPYLRILGGNAPGAASQPVRREGGESSP